MFSLHTILLLSAPALPLGSPATAEEILTNRTLVVSTILVSLVSYRKLLKPSMLSHLLHPRTPRS